MSAKKGIAILKLRTGRDEFTKEVASLPVLSGSKTTVGGAATETFTVTGALTSDIAVVTVSTAGASPVTVAACKVSAANTLSVTFSANPADDHVISYVLFRAV